MNIQTTFKLNCNLTNSEFTGSMQLTYPDNAPPQQIQWVFSFKHDSAFHEQRPTRIFVDEKQAWQFDLQEFIDVPKRYYDLQPEQQALVYLMVETEDMVTELRHKVGQASRLKELSQSMNKYMGAEGTMGFPEVQGTITLDNERGEANFAALRGLSSS